MAKNIIEPLPPSPRIGQLIILVTAAILFVSILSDRVDPWLIMGLIFLMVGSFSSRSFQAGHISILTLFLITLPQHLPENQQIWPFPLLIPLVFYMGVVVFVPSLRRSVQWVRWGRFEKDIRYLSAIAMLIPCISLVLWFFAVKPDINIYLRNIPPMPFWALPFVGFGFALVNAAMEESIFRGIVLQSLESTRVSNFSANLIQAFLFGILHYHKGFPNGTSGVILASAYGLMLGLIRQKARGMFAPWLTHVLADLIIFLIIIVASGIGR